jgi:hypothetical protein
MEPQPTRYRVGPASIALPGAWQPTQIQQQRIVFTNRASPEEQLIAYYGQVPRPEPADSVLVNRVLPMEGIRKSRQDDLQPTTLKQGDFYTASLVLITRKTPLTSTRVIQSIGVATQNGQGHWIFNLRLNPTANAIEAYGEGLPNEQLRRVQEIMQTLEPLAEAGVE